MRGHAMAGLLMGGWLWASGACFSPVAYACVENAQCQVDGIAGVCEPSGYCSFLDESCPSSRRYSPFAAGALAGACVESGADNTTQDGATGSGAGATGSGGQGTTRGGSSEESGGSSEESGEGPLPGEPLWSNRDTALGAARGRAVTVIGGELAVTGSIDTGEGTQVLVARYETDTGERISQTVVAAVRGADLGTGRAIVALPRGGVAIAGERTAAAGDLSGFTAVLDADGTTVWQRSYNTLQDDVLRGVAVTAGRIVSAGQTGDAGLIVAYDALGGDAYQTLLSPRVDTTRVGLNAAAGTTGGSVWFAGTTQVANNEYRSRLLRLTFAGSVVVDTSVPDVRAMGVAPGPDFGAITVGLLPNGGWLGRADGAGVTTTAGTAPGALELRAVATSEDGRTVAVGTTGTAAWVVAYEVDGSVRWEMPAQRAPGQFALGVSIQDERVYVVGHDDTPTIVLWVQAFGL